MPRPKDDTSGIMIIQDVGERHCVAGPEEDQEIAIMGRMHTETFTANDRNENEG